MPPSLATPSGVHDSTLRAVRQTQALVIAALDALATKPGPDNPRPLGRLWRLQLDVFGLVLDEPLQMVDQTFDTSSRLVALNREFLHRVMEAMDTRQRTAPTRGGADVVPIMLHR